MMSNHPTSLALVRLRQAVANTLAIEVKAQNLPHVCEELGMESGGTDEAFLSKFKFVAKRLPSQAEPLLAIADRVVQRFHRFQIEEALWLARDEDGRRSTEITRRNVLHALAARGSIEGRLLITEFLKRTWPLEQIPASWGTLQEAFAEPFHALSERTLEDQIHRHMVHNSDWDYHDLFEQLGLLAASERRFLHFLEQVVHPVVRAPGEQQAYAEAINEHLQRDGLELRAVQEVSGYPVYQVVAIQGGVQGRPKNLIFAANGPKPEIVLRDALNNDVQIIKNAEFCLVYDHPIPTTGLHWGTLLDWWAELTSSDRSVPETANALYKRLTSALASPPEKFFFRRYYQTFGAKLNQGVPALLPQVYLHYDPYTVRDLGGTARLPRQRMDFLMLFSSYERVVFEIDGKHHYADGDSADPRRYAEMAAADRQLRLAGYDVYRFGAVELDGTAGERLVDGFFESLLAKHRLP